MKSRYVLCLVLGLVSLDQSARGADWPQWRGPQRNGISQETGLLSEWPQGGPRLVWQVADLGGGYSTPAVVGERLYLQTNQGTSDESVEARAAVDGKKLWATRIGKVGNPDQRPNYPAARSTPTVDGQRLYALGSDGDLACLDIGTGKVQWQRNIRKDFGGQPGEWAYSESPLVDSNVVVCTPGGADATLVALDKNSGEVVWKSAVAGGDPAGYASIIKVETDGLQQYVQFLGKGLVGVEATTGKVLWRYDRTGSGPANIPTPVAVDALVYSGGAKSGGGLVRLSVKDGNVEAAEVYFDMGLPNGIGGAVQVGQHLYGSIAAGLVCLEFQSGKNLWTSRSIGPASLCYADGRLYLHGENSGEVALVEATPEEYRERGRFTPPNLPDRGRSKSWAYPVVANGRLYIRDLGSLWCYDVKAQ